MSSTRFLIILLLLSSVRVNAQTGSGESIDQLSLQELMNIKLTVASAKELTPRESPGVVSYITAEDIRKSGARDLMELLNFVPGFEFASDVEGVVGLAIRGNWAHEGKSVLLIDGIEMNETLYSTLQFGSHYPVENIDRIEIIRGPGSALYGGFAAYAVINVITRKTRNPSETSVSVNAGVASKGLTQSGFSASKGFKKGKIAGSLNVQYSNTERSQENYTDVHGNSYNMHNNSDLNNFYVNGHINIGRTQLQILADQYNTTSRDGYVEILPEKYEFNFGSYNATLSHELKLGESWKVVPKLTYSFQTPWNNPGDPTSAGIPKFDVHTNRITGQINASGTITSHFNLLTGLQFFNDQSTQQLEGNTFTRSNSDIFNYKNTAVYIQGLYNINNWNLIAGVRGNYNNQFDPTLTPRVGVTYVRNNWHIKALYNKSFRSPSTENLDLAESIYPEQTTVGELEAGFAIAKSFYFTANIYHINTVDPIIYYFDTIVNSDAYINLSKIGSVGFETTLQYKNKKGQAEANFSYYKPENAGDIEIYSSGRSDQYLGLSPVKANFRYRYNFSNSVTGTFSVCYRSSKYGITAADQQELQEYTRLPQTFVCNIYIEYLFTRIKGMGLGAGINNMLDQDIWFVQPYNSNHAPLPGMGREFTLKAFFRNF